MARKQFDKALDPSLVLESLPIAITGIDPSGRILFANHAAGSLLGAELTGTVFAGLFDPAHRTELERRIERAQYGSSQEFCSTLRTGVRCEIALERMDGGVLCVMRKIARHDAFLVRLDDAIRPLSDPREITDTAVRLLCEHLEADRCSYAEIHTGADQIDVLGNYSPRLPSIVGRYSTPSFGPEFYARMSAGKPQVFRDAQVELDPNAARAYAAMNIRAIVAVPILKQGRLVAGLGVHQASPRDWRDDEIELVGKVANRCWESIERGRVERALRASEEQARQSNEDLRRVNADLKQFAWSASHDLREPLRMVSLYSQLLGRELQGKLSADQERYLEYVRKGAQRLDTLIRDLLAYTQLADTPAGADPRADANECLQQALLDLAAAIQETGARVTCGSLPPAGIAAVHLALVFQNLIGNALKYRGQEIPDIRIAGVREGGECRFSVSDNGIGIDPEYARQIFGIFKRLHTEDEFSGTGIGLAICHRIVQRAGGRIWVESKPGQGSTFHFTLPPAEQP